MVGFHRYSHTCAWHTYLIILRLWLRTTKIMHTAVVFRLINISINLITYGQYTLLWYFQLFSKLRIFYNKFLLSKRMFLVGTLHCRTFSPTGLLMAYSYMWPSMIKPTILRWASIWDKSQNSHPRWLLSIFTFWHGLIEESFLCTKICFVASRTLYLPSYGCVATLGIHDTELLP